MSSAIVMLTLAVEDVRRGRWSDAELENQAEALDVLVAALRGEDVPVVINAEQ
ncbi:hypothetical protein [Saccharopolyspora shandongensis]|uniref:hypothetical protein n=1 Tax=Saccharopolyspora shandongensis TaxID=418495 RepID=UPI0034116764